MPSEEEILQQQQLLVAHRNRLAGRLRQQAKVGEAHVTPDIFQDILDARADIRRIKSILRNWDVVVEDLPNDEDEMRAVGSAGKAPLASQPPHTARMPQGGQDFIER